MNIVGSGGGPATFNLSTAAAILAAAVGVPVVKSGSRGYSSRHGSVDLLKLLRIPLARSQEELAAQLDARGIAFAGPFAYPRELALLAKRIFPVDWRKVGAFVNRIGPFLAAVPADAQLTGVSDPALLPLYEALPIRRRLWLVTQRRSASTSWSRSRPTRCAETDARGRGDRSRRARWETSRAPTTSSRSSPRCWAGRARRRRWTRSR